MTSQPGATESSDDAIRPIVEEFIRLHESRRSVEPEQFSARYPAEQREAIRAQCRAYLDLVQHLGLTREEPEAGPVGTQGPRALGEFELLEELGRGGMGLVYLARQPSVDRLVAIKVLPQSLLHSDRRVELFRREAAAVGKLHHRGIVPVHTVGEDHGTHFYTMDYVRGGSLQNLLDRMQAHRDAAGEGEPEPTILPGRSRVAAIAELAAQVAEALQYAHDQGVIHRDIKPQNILLGEHGEARITDFGLAKDLGVASISVTGDLHGTYFYMSPEQALAKRVPLDHRTDVFSLGVVLYELLALQRPFDGANSQQVLYEITFKEPVPIRKRAPQVPRDLQTICHKALEKDPARRFASAGEMAADLRRFLQLEAIHARPAGPATRSLRWLRGHRTPSVALAVSTFLLLCFYVWSAQDAAADTAKARSLVDRAKTAREGGDLNEEMQLLAVASELSPEDPVIKERLAACQLDLDHRRREGELLRQKAETAEGMSLIDFSRTEQSRNPGLALLLAIEGARRAPGRLANNNLLAALDRNRERRALVGHLDAVRCAAFSPDGKLAVTAADDWTARVWNTGTGHPSVVLSGHTGAVHWAAFDPSGRRVVTASTDRTARVWTLDQARSELVLKGHTGAVRCAVFSPDGSLIATASEDGTACLWDAFRGEDRRVLARHEKAVRSVSFSADGSRLVTASEDARFIVWDVTSAAPLTVSQVHEPGRGPLSFRLTCATFAPDGRDRILVASGGSARIVDAGTGAAISSFGAFVRSAVFDRDGTRVVTTSTDRSVRVWDVKGPKPMDRQSQPALELHGHRGEVFTAVFDAMGETVLSASADDTARIWNVLPGNTALPVLGPSIHTAVFSPDARLLATASATEGRIRVWNVATATLVRELAAEDGVHLLPPCVFSPDSAQILTPASGGGGHAARLIKIASGKQVVLGGHRDSLCSVAFAPTGERMATASIDGEVRIWGRDGAGPLTNLKTAHLRSVAFHPRGHQILTATAGHYYDAKQGRTPDEGVQGESAAMLWDATTGMFVRTFPCEDLFDAAISPDGSRLLLVNPKGARIVDLGTNEQLAMPVTEWPLRVAFDASGQSLVAALNRGPAEIVDSATGSKRASLKSHADKITWVSFSPDGSRVLTASMDLTARVWDARSGAESCTLEGHSAWLIWAAFSPDGRMIATLGRDGTARLWPADPLAAAERLQPRSLLPEERDQFDLWSPPESAVRSRVERLFEQWYSRTEVERRVREDASLDGAAREAALRLVEAHGDRPWQWEKNAWLLAQTPIAGKPPSDALFLAESACRLVPDHASFLRTLGAALYRAGRYQEAHDRLTRADELDPDLASNLAFLAMTSQRLGWTGKARAVLDRLEGKGSAPDLTDALRREAVAVLAEPAAKSPR